ncbi:MAG: Nramp family divalent metal transporter [Syntrophomonadaceae bacterium]|jgi:NRAMP (natural resistance-associated macrophage protein)-like metal ion transporter|nr:Nramp family divalent metal transporter [Syntrophomonadaceae bacterium]
MKTEIKNGIDNKPSLWMKLKNVGPAAVITAAFIGPGTVTTATLAGVNYQYALLWAMLFSTLATMLLQEMSARIGIVTGQGLGAAIRETFQQPAGKVLAALLIVSALGIGNSAFQAGNITGASMGLEVLFGLTRQTWAVIIALVAFGLLWTGSYKVLEKVLIAMVVLMSLVFIATAVVVRPDFSAMLQGLFVPYIPAGALFLTLGLIGTTVVPYNLYLHSAVAAERWGKAIDKKESIKNSNLDILVSIGLGGFISMAIIITAAAMHGTGAVKNAADMARQLEPLLGPWAKWFFATGLFAAGTTSAITAPLAASYAITAIVGWSTDMKSSRFRAIWIAVLGAGAAISFSGVSPVQIILFAQGTNGILLPISAIFLLVVMNKRRIMQKFVNSSLQNVLGSGVVLVTLLLGVRMILRALKIWP